MSQALDLSSTVLANLSASTQSLNSSSSSSILVDPGPIYKSYTIAYFFIGFFITIASSLLNAFGINLQKLDLNRSQNTPTHQRTRDCLRPVWVLGLALYIISQVLGSTLALQYMRSEYVAPLGSTSLIFNFLFARWLLGTKITLRDVLGTLVVILGVVGVIGFGNIRQAGIDQEANMSLSTLKALWARPQWLCYLVLLELTTIFTIWLASIAFELIQEKTDHDSSSHRQFGADDDEVDIERVLRRGGGRIPISRPATGFIARSLGPLVFYTRSLRNWLKQIIERWSVSRPEDLLNKLDGLLWGCGAGLLAGQTLVFAKSYVKLITNGLSHDGSGQLEDLANPLSILILIFLIVTSIFQVWCLNRGLKVYDSTLIVPVLFATYTACGFINSLIYLHELPVYRSWVLFMIWVCIAILISGVYLLSAKKPDANPAQLKSPDEYSSSADPEGDAQHTTIGLRHNGMGMTISRDSSKRVYESDKEAHDSHSISHRHNSRSRSASVMSLGELKDHLSDSFGRHRAFDVGSAKSREMTSSQRGLSNPFEEFEIGVDADAEDPIDLDEDEIDGLCDVRTGTVDPARLPTYREVSQDLTEDGDGFGTFVEAKTHIP